MKKLFETKDHPYLTIKSTEKTLIVNFREGQHSFIHWHTIKFKYMKGEGFVLVDKKP